MKNPIAPDEVQALLTDETLKRGLDAFEEVKAILVDRGVDYGGLKVDDYMPFGLASYVQMVHLKAARLVSGVHQALPEHKLEDSCLDLLACTAFLYGYLKRPQEDEA